jgi:hypothetical protein
MSRTEIQREFDAAIAAERSAYAFMRTAVPQLALPAELRGPLTPAQDAAVSAFEDAERRLVRARRAILPLELRLSASA